MSPQRLFTAFPVSAGVLLSCLLLAGCASEQALNEQTLPLRERIDRLEQALATAQEAASRAAQDQASASRARQAELEQRLAGLQAEIRVLRDQLQGLGERAGRSEAQLDKLAASLPERLAQAERRLAEVAATAQAAAEQVGAFQKQQGVAADAGSALAQRLALAEQSLNELAGQARAAGDKLGAIQQLQGSAANASAALGERLAQAELRLAELAATLPQRLAQAEQRIKALSDSVDEALALAAQENFLANGKEAFTVSLTGDKVLYPINDPTIDGQDAAKLDDLVKRVATLDQEYHLDIQGHTDSNSTDDYNYNLGKARAEVVKRYLHDKKGLSINRMSVISYGANKPLAAGGHGNRRVYIRVLVLK